MKIKNEGYDRSVLNPFDLLGTDEVGLSKAFAYILGKEPLVLYRFLHYLGVKVKNTEANYRKTTIEIERVRDEGRTDIEIKQLDKFHIIIECKVRKNKVQTQRRQYLKSFDSFPQKVLCFITQTHDYKKEVHEGIQIHNLGWIDIINLLDEKLFLKNAVVRDFLNFSIKGYKMREQKEILVQDLGDSIEIQRFCDFQIYRRDVIFGSPLYFSPYFTRNSKREEGEGISYLSKILGILTLSPKNISNFEDDLNKFSDDSKVTKKWIKGVELGQSKDVGKTFTYFFLAEPLKLKSPLRKDGTNKKGRGKNWIAAMIPKNRCVSFEEFTKRAMEASNG